MVITPDQILTLAGYATKYGPEAVQGLINLLKKQDPTLEEAEAQFQQLKPYEAFGIPDVAPTAPTLTTGDELPVTGDPATPGNVS